ncbi:hypothetical protein [Nannocystis sp. SCPEA4]|uniref:hypothetical protein n=1 Tax=Nannocystis sp. SCPEA4 TaxID=2996787 RepID=UPI00226F7F9C|nr:hypothetical protein [Nannocystis sp. SCPEA4]MCY1061001.1 hypothetical protein [Nannocystis sp. SCPEA4]
MQHRIHIPALALLGLSFTGCPDDEDKPNPIVGDWSAIQLDGEKFPVVYSEDSYTGIYGLRLTVEDDLAGRIDYYSVVDYDDFSYQHSFGSDLVVDASGAPKYRLEVRKDPFDGDDVDYSDTAAAATSEAYDSDGYDSSGTDGDGTGTDGYLGGGSSLRELAAPHRPILAPAEVVLTCTLEQDILTCAAEPNGPKSVVFKRKVEVEPADE